MGVPAAEPVAVQLRGFRLAAWVTAVNVLVASGFSLTGLLSPASLLPPGVAPTTASFLFAAYGAARTIPLALVALAAIYYRSARALLVLGALAGLVQACDVLVGIAQRDPGKTFGPLVIAVVQFYAVFVLNRSLRSGTRRNGTGNQAE